jgi:uncharacterized protein YkwD
MRRGRLVIALVLALTLPAAGYAGTSDASLATLTRSSSLEGLVLSEINSVRAARGLRPLSRSEALSRAAVGHSRSMVTLGFFSHESRNGTPFSQRLSQFYTRSSNGWSVGENLAMFAGVAPTAKAIVDAWMASPSHRANVLRQQFREAGIAIVHHPAAGGVFGGLPTWVVTLDVGRR